LLGDPLTVTLPLSEPVTLTVLEYVGVVVTDGDSVLVTLTVLLTLAVVVTLLLIVGDTLTVDVTDDDSLMDMDGDTLPLTLLLTVGVTV